MQEFAMVGFLLEISLQQVWKINTDSIIKFRSQTISNNPQSIIPKDAPILSSPRQVQKNTGNPSLPFRQQSNLSGNMSITSSNTNRNSEKIRIVFLGDQSVGKSSIIDRYTTNKYQQTHTSTVGIDFNVKDVCRKGHNYRLQMWDTAGQERYRSLIPTYLKNAQLAVFVCDLTKESSLESIKMWHKLFKEHQDAPGVVVGNKVDLSSARKVSKEDGERVAGELKMKYYEVSAKTGKRIGDLFEDVLETIISEIKKQQHFVESSREKMRDFKTVQSEGVECCNETRADNKAKPISLKTKVEQFANSYKCCSST